MFPWRFCLEGAIWRRVCILRFRISLICHVMLDLYVSLSLSSLFAATIVRTAIIRVFVVIIATRLSERAYTNKRIDFFRDRFHTHPLLSTSSLLKHKSFRLIFIIRAILTVQLQLAFFLPSARISYHLRGSARTTFS